MLGAPGTFVPNDICVVAVDGGLYPKLGTQIWGSATLEYRALSALKETWTFSRAPGHCRRFRVPALLQAALSIGEGLEG